MDIALLLTDKHTNTIIAVKTMLRLGYFFYAVSATMAI